MRTIFNPTPSDFDLTCTATCKDSIDTYLLNLIKSCAAPGDGALKALDLGNSRQYAKNPEPVHVVGWVLQYVYAQSCSRDDAGQYCYFGSGAANNKFECSDECNVQFYSHTHNYPGARWRFNHYNLIDQTSWWEEYFVGGWKRAVTCGAVEVKTRYADVKAVLAVAELKTETTGSVVPTASGSSVGKGNGKGEVESSGAGGAGGGSSVITTALPETSVQTSCARRLRGIFAGLF